MAHLTNVPKDYEARQKLGLCGSCGRRPGDGAERPDGSCYECSVYLHETGEVDMDRTLGDGELRNVW